MPFLLQNEGLLFRKRCPSFLKTTAIFSENRRQFFRKPPQRFDNQLVVKILRFDVRFPPESRPFATHRSA